MKRFRSALAKVHYHTQINGWEWTRVWVEENTHYEEWHHKTKPSLKRGSNGEHIASQSEYSIELVIPKRLALSLMYIRNVSLNLDKSVLLLAIFHQCRRWTWLFLLRSGGNPSGNCKKPLNRECPCRDQSLSSIYLVEELNTFWRLGETFLCVHEYIFSYILSHSNRWYKLWRYEQDNIAQPNQI